METRKGWWFDLICVLICVGMIVYGVAVLWYLIERGGSLYDIGKCASALLIVIVGTVCLLRDVGGPADERTPSALGAALEPYVLAWRRLWRTKWLLWVFGVVAVIAISSAVAQLLIGRVFFGTQNAHLSSMFPNELSLLDRLHYLLPDLLNGAWGEFVPGLYLSADMPGYVAATAVMVILVLPNLPRVRREPECAGKVSFLAACMILAVLAGIVALLDWLTVLHQASQMNQADRIAAAMGPPRFWTLFVISALVVAMVAVAAFVGAVLGSLARSSRGGQVTRRTLLIDAVRCFQPLAAFYVLYSILMFLPSLPIYLGRHQSWTPGLPVVLLAVPFMFAPLGVAAHGLGFGGSIWHSLEVWGRTWSRTFSFIAVGTFLFALAMLPVRVLPWLAPGDSPLAIPVSAVATLINVVASALILLAVWEFYTTNVTDRGPASETA